MNTFLLCEAPKDECQVESVATGVSQIIFNLTIFDKLYYRYVHQTFYCSTHLEEVKTKTLPTDVRQTSPTDRMTGGWQLLSS